MNLEAAINEWSDLLAEHVITNAEELRAAATATFNESRCIPAIIRPGSRTEVQACLRVANRHGVPLYPVSSGRNWGYGSRLPALNGCALLDLRRLNRILDLNEELGYVTLEPGVTQVQLFEYLRARGSKLWMDATGSSPDCSVVGNTMERGFGHTPYSDHFGNACALEVVLPNGEIIDTGFGRFPDACAAPLYRPGVGPSVDGLFSQSNLGIATRMTVWLMPAPERVQAFFFRCDHDTDLPGLIDALRPLRMRGLLRSAVHIGNDYKVLSGIQQFPWEETGGQTPLTRDILQGARRKLGFGAWNGSGALYGTAREVAEARRVLRRSLRGRVARLTFMDDRRIRLLQAVHGPLQAFVRRDLAQALGLVKSVFGLLQGIPTSQPLRSCYWRKRGPIPDDMDPDRDRCGLLWLAPVLPLRGSDAVHACELAARTLLQFGFEPILSLTLLTERALGCVISISYDRDKAGEDERARSCHDVLLKGLMARGYYPYRLGAQSMWLMDQPNSYNRFIAQIRDAIDPNRILAPGRYEGERRLRQFEANLPPDWTNDRDRLASLS